MKHKEWGIIFIFIVVIGISIFLRFIHGVQLSNVNDRPTYTEEEFTRVLLDTSKYSKKQLAKVTIIDGVVYENTKEKDKKNDNALVKVVQGIINNIKPLPNNLHDYDLDEVKDEDVIIPSNLKVNIK